MEANNSFITVSICWFRKTYRIKNSNNGPTKWIIFAWFCEICKNCSVCKVFSWWEVCTQRYRQTQRESERARKNNEIWIQIVFSSYIIQWNRIKTICYADCHCVHDSCGITILFLSFSTYFVFWLTFSVSEWERENQKQCINTMHVNYLSEKRQCINSENA